MITASPFVRTGADVYGYGTKERDLCTHKLSVLSAFCQCTFVLAHKDIFKRAHETKSGLFLIIYRRTQ